MLLVVADGVGLAPDGPANALSVANTPTIDRLLSSKNSTRLHAHGTHVGLPSDADMGNSEVGHNTLGGGRVFDQGAKLVGAAMENGSLFAGDNWQEVERRGINDNTVHFLGLLSDGNVHSHIDHLLVMLKKCAEANIHSVAVHILLDGRDVDPRSAPKYIEKLGQAMESINQLDGFNYRIASGGGRMVITMDRYEADWEMIRKGYDIHVHGSTSITGREVSSALVEVNRQFNENDSLSDQYLTPFVVTDDAGPVGKMEDGDAVVLFNFRGDRAIEISRSFDDPDFDAFDRGKRPEVFFCGMLQFDGDLNVPDNYLVNPPVIEQTMVEYMCAEKLRTFAISETQKFGHVTYFWNGNKSGYLDESLETYIEIPSDNCEFNTAPEMKAREITDATIELLDSGTYQFGRINFANGDMVGHTGDITATATSLECVDQCMARLIDAVDRNDGILLFTADHGNADEMFVERDGKRISRTSHSLNPVPFVIHDPQDAGEYQINKNIEGGLANVAATVFNLMGYRAPEDYEPSLLNILREPVRRTLYKGRVVNLGLESIVLPNDELMALEMVRHPGGAVILAADDDENICLIKQFRHAADGWIWELPAGILEPGEQPQLAAIRELKEETGCEAETWNVLGDMLTSPGFCDEKLYTFLARDISTGEPSPDHDEFIEVHWLPLNKVETMITEGILNDAKSIVAIHQMRLLLAENQSPGSAK